MVFRLGVRLRIVIKLSFSLAQLLVSGLWVILYCINSIIFAKTNVSVTQGHKDFLTHMHAHTISLHDDQRDYK